MRLRLPATAAIIAGCLAVPATALAQDLDSDLRMAPSSDLKTERTSDGRSLLRFTTRIFNAGQGSFQLRGTRSSTAESQMSVVQEILQTDGSRRVVPTAARMYFAGDGHSHWHVADLEDAALIRTDNGVKVGSGAKHGFCFFDLEAYNLGLPGAPASPVYRTCGTSPGVLTQTMGLSIGWADVYAWHLAYQWIDITGLGAGRYELRTTADASNWFEESDEANNSSSIVIQLKSKGQPRIVG